MMQRQTGDNRVISFSQTFRIFRRDWSRYVFEPIVIRSTEKKEKPGVIPICMRDNTILYCVTLWRGELEK